MNLEEMETALKRYGFDAKDPLKVWLNAALHEIEDEFDWPWLEQKPELVAMPAGSSTITLPAEALKVISIKDETNIYKLNYFDWHRFERDIREPEEQGLPEIYTLSSMGEVKIWRVLERETNFRVKVQLQTKDLALVADKPKTGTREWPVNTHFPIVIRAAVIGFSAENEEDRSEKLMKQADAVLMRLKLKYGQREMDEPTTVADVQGYGQQSPSRWQ